MTKQELIKQIARETGVEATTVSAVVEGFMEEGVQSIARIFTSAEINIEIFFDKFL